MARSIGAETVDGGWRMHIDGKDSAVAVPRTLTVSGSRVVGFWNSTSVENANSFRASDDPLSACHQDTLDHSVFPPVLSLPAMAPKIPRSFSASSRPRSDIFSVAGPNPGIPRKRSVPNGAGPVVFDSRSVAHWHSRIFGSTSSPSPGGPPPRADIASRGRNKAVLGLRQSLDLHPPLRTVTRARPEAPGAAD